jgi:hypothetical protein
LNGHRRVPTRRRYGIGSISTSAIAAAPAARTLGFEVLDADPDEGRIEVAFSGTEAFTNPFGEVLGGTDWIARDRKATRTRALHIASLPTVWQTAPDDW